MNNPPNKEIWLVVGLVLIVLIGISTIKIMDADQPKFWGLITLIIAGGSAVLFKVFYGYSQKRKIFDPRVNLSDQQIFSTYYSESGFSRESVIELWNEIAKNCQVPPGKLRPTDRFGKEAGSYLITSEELDSLGVCAQNRAEKLKHPVDLSGIKTVDDYIKVFAERKN